MASIPSYAALWREALSVAEMRRAGALTLALIIWGLYEGGAPVTTRVAAGGLGVASWFVAEYLFHRWVLHLPLAPVEPFRSIQLRAHAKHHREPKALRYLFVPTPAVLLLLAIAAGLGRLSFGVGAATATAAGFGLALCFYEITHLAAHVPYRPRTRLGRRMRRRHLLHHYKNERYWFGVTNPLFDRLLGTLPAADAVERSASARDLGGEVDADASAKAGSDTPAPLA